MTYVLGVDGCRGGWCAVSIHDEGRILSVPPPAIFRSFQQVLASSAEVICVDIPIGLLDGPGQRACDAQARQLLGRRASTVFTPPCRSALQQENHTAASEANRRITGKGLPIQTHSISDKIAEVDSLVTPDLQSRVYEVHPEVCFWALNHGQPMSHKKARLAGPTERWRPLRKALPSLPKVPPPPRDLPAGCAVDDYVDALVAAWTADCIARGSATHIPHNPSMDDQGLRMEMWFPSV